MQLLKKKNEKGQLAAIPQLVIGVVLAMVVVALLLTVGTTVNVKVYDSIDDDISALDSNTADWYSVQAQIDANQTIEAGFENLKETGDNTTIVVIGLMAALVIAAVVGGIASATRGNMGAL